MIVIQPAAKGIFQNLAQAWQYRRLLSFLMQRFVKAFYRGTRFGIGWVVIRLTVPAIVAASVFGNVIKVPSDGLPYLLFYFSGLCIWNLFANSMRILTRSLKVGRRLVIHLYFPKILLPVAGLGFSLMELAFNILMVVLAAIYYQVTTGRSYFVFGAQNFLSLYFLLLMFLITLGVGFVTSVLNTFARDIRFAMPYVVQFLFLITPVFYPLSAVPKKWHFIFAINPMMGILEGFRWSLFGTGQMDLSHQAVSAAGALLIFWAGLWFFTRTEAILSDYL